jgi:glycosyltransferase involved in cell wall biosynthesis
MAIEQAINAAAALCRRWGWKRCAVVAVGWNGKPDLNTGNSLSDIERTIFVDRDPVPGSKTNVPQIVQGTIPIPARLDSVILVGGRDALSVGLLVKILKRRTRYVVAWLGKDWTAVRTSDLLAVRVALAIERRLAQRFGGNAGPYAARLFMAAWRVFICIRVAAERLRGSSARAIRRDFSALKRCERLFLGQFGSGRDCGVSIFRRLLECAPPPGEDPAAGEIVIASPDLSHGGAQRQIVNTALGLKASGVDNLTVVVKHLSDIPRGDFFVSDLQKHGIEVARYRPALSTDTHWQSLQDRKFREVYCQIDQCLAGFPPEFVKGVGAYFFEFCQRKTRVVHAWLDSCNAEAGIAAVLAGAERIILSARNLNPSRLSYEDPDIIRAAYIALLELPQVLLVANSAAGANDYAEWLGISADRIRIVRNGFDMSVVPNKYAPAANEARRAGSQKQPLVTGVFRLAPEKRPVLWLQAAAIIRERFAETRFLLVGDGELHDEVENWIVKLNLRPSLEWRPPSPNVFELLAASYVLLLTSVFEGTPNIILEAQALGIPVVATEAGGTREAFDPGRSGLLVENPEASSIAAAVLELLGDPQKRTSYGSAGPAFVENRFGNDRMRNETLELYGLPTGQGKEPG